MHRAGTALSETTAKARPVQTKLVPENIEKRRIGVIDGDRYRPAVHVQGCWRHGTSARGIHGFSVLR
jgi:hypothetical protein